ncbi:MAG: hypothetical protein NBKEAIPA_02833 [Nitrospirae bacterium]|nr:hypothetical protein [Nitrospirota bacterium]
MFVREVVAALRDKDVEAGLDGRAQFFRELTGAGHDFFPFMEEGGRLLPDQLFRAIAQQGFSRRIEGLDESVGLAGNNGVAGIVEKGLLKEQGGMQFGLGAFLLGDIANRRLERGLTLQTDTGEEHRSRKFRAVEFSMPPLEEVRALPHGTFDHLRCLDC